MYIENVCENLYKNWLPFNYLLITVVTTLLKNTVLPAYDGLLFQDVFSKSFPEVFISKQIFSQVAYLKLGLSSNWVQLFAGNFA